jgi:cystathionine gamma-synthase
MTDRADAFKPRTIAAQALGAIEPETKGVALPVHVSTTFIRGPDNQYRTGYIYGRPDNATVRQTEAVIAALEGAHEALLFGSGMAAATSVVLALPPGSHVLAPQVCYWGLRDWLKNEAPLFGYRVDLVDMSDVAAVRVAMKPDTKLVWIETPANPLWTITDIAAVAEVAHAGGAILGIDSTAATPLFSKPLSLGADIVMHSATKYLNGHSDVIAGVLAAKREDTLWTRIKQVRSHHGAILGPFEAWLLLRGLRTLDVRVRAAADSAGMLATRFANHQSVSSVLYPGLPTHPGHAVAARQMSGFSGMLSIRVKGGERAAIDAAARVKLWKRATSLGGVESLIEHRASIEGPGSPCPPDLLRLSVGLEDPEDLYDDLDRALRAANA